MSSYSRWRKATLRRQCAAVKECSGPVYCDPSKMPPLPTADEIIANCRKLLGHTLFADVVIGAELRWNDYLQRIPLARLPMVVVL